MPSSKDALTPVYLPSNEPYLGRDSLFRFDQAIQVCLEANADVAAYTRRAGLTDLQTSVTFPNAPRQPSRTAMT